MRLVLVHLCFVVFTSIFTYSQTDYIDVNSPVLKTKRQIKLQLPRNYTSSQKKYPVIIVLDGDYLFEPFAGNVDYLSYWNMIPEAIVVGINQSHTREKDGKIDPDNELPISTGADFFEFVGFEVLKHIGEQYRTTDFAIIAGLDFMANFSNFYLLREKPLFNGYIALSPDVTPKLPERLKRRLDKIDQKIWYYLATSEQDIPGLKAKTINLNSYLATIRNSKFNYRYQVFEDANHFSFVAEAIPKSLQSIFSTYGPISDFEYQSKLLSSPLPSTFLEDKYQTIEKLYALKVPIRVVDFIKTSEAIEEQKLWADYQNLSKLAKKEAATTVLHNYFQGRYFEEIGQPKRAIKEYQSAYGLESAGYLTSDVLLGRADELKKTFGN